MLPLNKKIGIEFFSSDLNVNVTNDINFLIVHEMGTLSEKDFEEVK